MKTNTIKSLAALIVAACLPAVATAQQFVVNGLAYNVLSATEHTVELIMKWSGTTYQGNITIPSTVTYGGTTYDVVALGENAFYASSVSSVTIPSSVTRIKRACFLFCTGPSTINIPASVTDIGELGLAARNMTAINVAEDNPSYRSIDGMLFSKDSTTLVECPLGKSGAITLPQSTLHIGLYAFGYCQAITGVTLHEGLASIGFGAFVFNNQLNNVVIPSTVSYIGSNIFEGCSSLTNLSMASSNSHYYMDGMMIYSAGGDTLVSCHKSADSLFLPASLRVVGGLGNNTDVRYVHVPEGVTTINENAFENSSLVSIDMPGSVTYIGAYAFYSCESLTRVGMPATLDTMGQGCFEYCTRLPSIDIPNGLRTVPNSAFFGNSALSHITWGDAVEVVDSFAFGANAFTELLLPPTLRSVRCGAFNGYYDGVLRRVTFSAPVDTIEPEAFTGHHLELLRLMNSEPPVSLITLEYGADYGCLIDATVDSLVIPCGSLDTYLADTYWGLFADSYVEDCGMGIDEVSDCSISVYPNPASGWLSVNMPGCSRVELVNMLGRVVLSQEVGGGATEINVSGLARGAYYIRLHASDGIATRKVVLQ